MTYQIVKIIHVLTVIGLLGPLLLTPKWLHLYKDEKGREILHDLHTLTGISGWIVFISGLVLLWFSDFVLFRMLWVKVSIFLFLAIQIFDHFWADKMEHKLEIDTEMSNRGLFLWLVVKILLYVLIIVLMVIK